MCQPSNLPLLCCAAEVYPTIVWATAHGLSAATGKTGALLPTVIFNYIGTAPNSTQCADFICLCGAAEVYPTSVRATAHGLSAATGKIGALLPTVIFNYIGNSTKFWVVCWAGLLGFLVTALFVPDLTGTLLAVLPCQLPQADLPVLASDI